MSYCNSEHVPIYKITYKDHTDLGDPTVADDDELLTISARNIGIGFTAKY